MKKLINMTTSYQDLERFSGSEDMRSFIRQFNLDGLELLPIADKKETWLEQDMVIGVHLHYFTNWMDLWLGNKEALIKEYGSLERAKAVFGGLDRETLINRIIGELNYAESVKAEYVVFHVSEVKTTEVFDRKFSYRDEEVIDISCELIQTLLDRKPYHFHFLLENLWWPGLTLTKPELTKRLIEGIRYDKLGLMLDTGHLMHTNIELPNEDAAVDYILKMLSEHGCLKEYIKGIHFNKSLSGAYIRQMSEALPAEEADYDRRLQMVYPHIFKIDSHEPFTAKRAGEIIKTINPEYLTFEFITNDRHMHEQYLKAQMEAMEEWGWKI